MNTHTPPDHYRIGILLIEGFALMSYAATVEPFRAANLLSTDVTYELIHLTSDGKPVSSSSGAVIHADQDISEQAHFDWVLVVAGGDPYHFHDDAVYHWLRQLSRAGVLLGGVSGGPVVLVNAGVMQGRRMTVHWEHSAALGEVSPPLLLERTLYVLDRDRMTCAGGTAPLDMMVALITRHQGSDFARQVCDWFMHTDIRPSEGPQRAGLAERYHVGNRSVLSAIEIMRNHLAEPFDLAHIARLVAVSPRQLNRLFHDHMGESTMAFYRELRLKKARKLLQQSMFSITDIALATGFSGSAHFSQAFRKRFGLPPSKVRDNHSLLNTLPISQN